MAEGISHFFGGSRFLSANGGITGATVYFYYTGTTTLAPIYSDKALTSPLTNPVVVAAGSILPNVFLDSSVIYRRRTVFSDGSVWDVDPVQVTSSAAYVSASDGATGTLWTTVQGFIDRVKNGIISALNTSNFIAPSAKINRIGDRVFVGGAVTQDGLYPNVTKDWLSTYETTTGGRPNGTMVSSQGAILNNDYFGAGVAWLTGVQSKNFISAATGASANTNVVVNNNTTYQVSAWAGYDEAHRDNDTVGSTIGREIDIRNGSSTYYPITPAAQHVKMTVGLQIASGAEYPASALTSAAINIRDNGSKFGKGIVFGVTSLDTVVNPQPSAVALAPNHALTWWSNTTNESWKIFSSAASGSGYVWHQVGNVTFGETDLVISKNSTSAGKNLTFSTANSSRWTTGSTATTESGSNAGSDFAISRFSDAGSYLGSPFQIRRSNGRIILSELQASTSYANDAAAAAGGVQIGELYRNGSVVQIRVT